MPGEQFVLTFSADKFIESEPGVDIYYMNRGTISTDLAICCLPVPWAFKVLKIQAAINPKVPDDSVSLSLIANFEECESGVVSENDLIGMKVTVTDLIKDIWVNVTVLAERTDV